MSLKASELIKLLEPLGDKEILFLEGNNTYEVNVVNENGTLSEKTNEEWQTVFNKGDLFKLRLSKIDNLIAIILGATMAILLFLALFSEVGWQLITGSIALIMVITITFLYIRKWFKTGKKIKELEK